MGSTHATCFAVLVSSLDDGTNPAQMVFVLPFSNAVHRHRQGALFLLIRSHDAYRNQGLAHEQTIPARQHLESMRFFLIHVINGYQYAGYDYLQRPPYNELALADDY